MQESYDVLVEQFRPEGVLDRLGVSHAALLTAHPQLVICALTGYGQTGPLARRAGHDPELPRARRDSRPPGAGGGPPAVPAVQMADVGGGLWSVIGILGALAERERTGRGQVVDVSMVEASMPFAIASFGQGFAGTAPPRRGDEPLTGGIAPYSTYATRDGRFVALAALEPKFWMAFCAGVSIEAELAALLPGPHQAALKQKLSAIFAARTRDEWAAFGAEHDCCLEPVLEPNEVARDPHLAARRRVFFSLRGGEGEAREMPQMKTPLTDSVAPHRAAAAAGRAHRRGLARGGDRQRRDRQAARGRRDSAEARYRFRSSSTNSQSAMRFFLRSSDRRAANSACHCVSPSTSLASALVRGRRRSALTRSRAVS